MDFNSTRALFTIIDFASVSRDDVSRGLVKHLNHKKDLVVSKLLRDNPHTNSLNLKYYEESDRRWYYNETYDVFGFLKLEFVEPFTPCIRQYITAEEYQAYGFNSLGVDLYMLEADYDNKWVGSLLEFTALGSMKLNHYFGDAKDNLIGMTITDWVSDNALDLVVKLLNARVDTILGLVSNVSREEVLESIGYNTYLERFSKNTYRVPTQILRSNVPMSIPNLPKTCLGYHTLDSTSKDSDITSPLRNIDNQQRFIFSQTLPTTIYKKALEGKANFFITQCGDDNYSFPIFCIIMDNE